MCTGGLVVVGARGGTKGLFVHTLSLSTNWYEIGTAVGRTVAAMPSQEKKPVSPGCSLNCRITDTVLSSSRSPLTWQKSSSSHLL